MNTVADMNVLYEAFLRSMKGSSWKEEPQRFEMDVLSELTKLQTELESGAYRTSRGSEFILNERGHIRYIHGGRVRDRVVRHALCDRVLIPAIDKYLIYNNGASQKGKGITFARKMLEQDLHSYFLETGTNEGYIAFVDFSKFYDNIRHDQVMEIFKPKIDGFSAKLLEDILRNFEVDVSYMTESEYASCMGRKYDSLTHRGIAEEKLTHEKMMRKSVDIGDQVSQVIGISYPTRIDNYATIVRGHRRYGRYMDDIYIIHSDREYLKETLEGIGKEAAKLGLFINERKTRICRLDHTFKYLQIKYFLTDTGKVVRRINPQSLTRQRKRLKAYKRLLDKGEMQYSSIEQAYKSWMGSYYRIMSKKQIRNMKALYTELFGADPRWR
jgi:hypothetical protein